MRSKIQEELTCLLTVQKWHPKVMQCLWNWCVWDIENVARISLTSLIKISQSQNKLELNSKIMYEFFVKLKWKDVVILITIRVVPT